MISIPYERAAEVIFGNLKVQLAKPDWGNNKSDDSFKALEESKLKVKKSISQNIVAQMINNKIRY